MPKKIIVCYLRADSNVLEDHILNRMASRVAPKYGDASEKAPVVHVELFFPDKSGDSGLSAGICYGGKAFMFPKKFSRPNWEFHSVPVTNAQYEKAIQFCNRQRGAPFNYRGFYLPRACGVGQMYREQRLTTHVMPWYCSELVAYALLHADVLDRGQTWLASAHPNAAHHVIQQHCDTFIDSARNYSNTPFIL